MLDFKRSLHERAAIRARDVAAPHEPAFHPLKASSGVSISNSIAPSAVESADVALDSSLVVAPSVNVPPPPSIDVATQTSIHVPIETSSSDPPSASLDVLVRLSVDDPTHTSIVVPVETSISDPISASTDVLVQNSIDISVPGSFPTEVPATSDYLPFEPSTSRSLQPPFPQTADVPVATAAGSVYLPLGGPATTASPSSSGYFPLGPQPTDTSELKPGYPVPSVHLPIGPTSASDSVDAPPQPTPTFYDSVDASDYLPLDSQPTDTSELKPGYPVTSAFLPLGPVTASELNDIPPSPTATYASSLPVSADLPLHTDFDVESSLYLPLEPTKPAGFDDGVFGDETSDPSPRPTATFYSTPDDSAFLPIGPTATYHQALPESEFLPLGPSFSPSPSRDIEPYIKGSLYLPLGPAKSAGPDDVVFGDETDYLPLGPIATALPSSNYLSLDPIVPVSSSMNSLVAFLPQSEYLPVAPRPKSQQYLPASLYLPLENGDGPATADPTPYLSKPLTFAAPAETAYLPLKSSNPQIENTPALASMPAASAFLPLVPLPSDDESANLPVFANVPDRSAYLPFPPSVDPGDRAGGPTGLPVLPFPDQPNNQDTAQDIRTHDALPLAVDPSAAIPLPNLSP